MQTNFLKLIKASEQTIHNNRKNVGLLDEVGTYGLQIIFHRNGCYRYMQKFGLMPRRFLLQVIFFYFKNV